MILDIIGTISSPEPGLLSSEESELLVMKSKTRNYGRRIPSETQSDRILVKNHAVFSRRRSNSPCTSTHTPCVARAEQYQNIRWACASCAMVPATGLGSLTRRRSALLLRPAVLLHVPSKWVFQKHPSRPPQYSSRTVQKLYSSSSQSKP